MRVAYLIDRNAVGGGMEYIRRKIASRPGDECRIFFADRRECGAANLNAWGAEEIHVNHLTALLQLFQQPFAQPEGKVVFTVHGIHLRKYDFLPHTIANRIKRFLRLTLERRLYAKCQKLIALTPTDAADIKRLYGKHLPVEIEPNTVDPAEFRKPPRTLRYRRDEFAFVCIARFNFQKGQDVFVRAIAQTQDFLRAKKKRSLFIGAGATFDAIRRLAHEMGVDDLIVFEGEIPAAGEYMTCGKFLVAPSRWEGMPYLLLEAVARKRNIIASDCPGNIDVLKDCPFARLFTTNDPSSLAALLRAL